MLLMRAESIATDRTTSFSVTAVQEQQHASRDDAAWGLNCLLLSQDYASITATCSNDVQ